MANKQNKSQTEKNSSPTMTVAENTDRGQGNRSEKDSVKLDTKAMDKVGEEKRQEQQQNEERREKLAEEHDIKETERPSHDPSHPVIEQHRMNPNAGRDEEMLNDDPKKRFTTANTPETPRVEDPLTEKQREAEDTKRYHNENRVTQDSMEKTQPTEQAMPNPEEGKGKKSSNLKEDEAVKRMLTDSFGNFQGRHIKTEETEVDGEKVSVEFFYRNDDKRIYFFWNNESGNVNGSSISLQPARPTQQQRTDAEVMQEKLQLSIEEGLKQIREKIF